MRSGGSRGKGSGAGRCCQERLDKEEELEVVQVTIREAAEERACRLERPPRVPRQPLPGLAWEREVQGETKELRPHG